ncbi:MAG: hypothetical protein ACI4DV_04845 [Lachnospiraceae bacterium]
MKNLRILIIVFFCVTAAGFAVYTMKDLAVKDTGAPVITSDTETIQVSITADEAQMQQGLHAQDDRDGDVTDSLVVVSHSKFFEKGKVRVNYAAFDKKGNVGTYTRVLEYTDYTSPRFSINSPLRYEEDEGNLQLLSKVKAEDCLDGDISGLIKLKYDEGSYVDIDEEGRAGVTFQVTNSFGDTVQLPVKLEFLDEENWRLPYPTLSEYLVYTPVNTQVDYTEYLTGVYDGGSEILFEDTQTEEDYRYFREDVSVDPQVDYSTPGVYPVIYTLTSSDEEEETEILGSVTMYVAVQAQ